jgi:chemotaxis receptor (MCP) glutamine deamidase CheD
LSGDACVAAERGYVKETFVRPMQCVFASEGVLRIDRIGSGVGIVLLHKPRRLAAGAHVLRGASAGHQAANPAYFADTVIPHMLDEFSRQGAAKPFSLAIAGGASLLNAPSGDDAGSKLVALVKAVLERAGLPITFEETGDIFVRSILLNIDAGKIKIVD